MTYQDVSIFVSVLHWVNIPPVGGDTLWVDIFAIAKGLPASMRQFLTGLTARHAIQKGFYFINENG